tara:strand:- start:10218 stop:11153 length:936 start_codon:yes stop_codon:yes gene_type:complete
MNYNELTPITKGEKWSYKREDLFSPYGEGGINGSKLRQVYHLCEFAKEMGYEGIVSGSVASSPQHPMITRVAKKYGLKTVVVTGASKLENYPMLLLAAKFGADFVFSKVGYASALNGVSKRIASERKYFHLETNITVTTSAQAMHLFHKVGGKQIQNIPDNIETLMIPAGSCNSATSVFVGLTETPLRNLRKIILFGIGAYGSKDGQFIPKRLKKIGVDSMIEYEDYFNFQTDVEPEFAEEDDRITVTRYDLNGTGYCKYSDWYPANKDGIEFHPRYEGKIIRYISDFSDRFKEYDNVNNCFWIVGSHPIR